MLRRGQKFTMAGHTFKVAYVNASRAHCVAREPRLVTVKGRTFTAHRRIEIDISTQSGLAVLADLERSRCS